MAANPECPDCEGTGWKEIVCDGIAAVERCRCVEAGRGAGRQKRTRIPPRFRNAGFDNFTLLDDNPVALRLLEQAMVTAKAFAREYPFAPKRGLLFQGGPGVGKTHLATAVLRELVGKGVECVFFDYQNLLEQIQSGYDPSAGTSHKETYHAALETEMLLIDDLGSRRVSDWVLDTVTTIINHRYNNEKALIVTTNLPDPDLGNKLSEKNPALGKYQVKDSLADRIGQRARSRLFEMCKVAQMGTRDYRLRELRRSRHATA